MITQRLSRSRHENRTAEVFDRQAFQIETEQTEPGALRAVAVGPTKRIWHVFNGNDELITAKSSDGSMFELAVYIGLLDGKLELVR